MMYARYGGSEHQTEKAGQLLRRAARMSRHLARPAAVAAVATIVATLARLAGPLTVRGGVDAGIDGGNEQAVLIAAGLYVMFLIIQYVTQRISMFLVAEVGERFLRDLREKVFRRLVNLDLAFYTRSKTGVLVSRMTSDVEALTRFVDEGAVTVVSMVLLVVGVAVAMFVVDVPLALAVMALLPLLVGASLLFRVFADRAYRRIREQIGLVLGAIQEGIAGVRVVQAYTQESSQADRFEEVNDEYYDANIEAAKAISLYFPAVDMLRTAGIVIILFLSGRRVLAGQMTLGSLLAFLLYLNWFFEPIIGLSNVYNLMQAAIAALSKLFNLMDEPKTVPIPEEPQVPAVVEGRLGFHAVTFGYDPELPVIDDMTLVVQPGERVAVVGETGAGKSTVAKLAVRFYDPDEGSVRLDGTDLRDFDPAALRNHVALVPQEGFLFSGTMRENLSFPRPDATDEELWRVAETMNIADWIRELPERLDTEVRERGSRLSSGERQLVALARALVADPVVIVLDEATSSLDPEPELRVEQALGRLLEGRTAIIIAHRLTTAERADRIVVMDAGQIVEIGSHEELLAKNGHYTALAAAWERSHLRA